MLRFGGRPAVAEDQHPAIGGERRPAEGGGLGDPLRLRLEAALHRDGVGEPAADGVERARKEPARLERGCPGVTGRVWSGHRRALHAHAPGRAFDPAWTRCASMLRTNSSSVTWVGCEKLTGTLTCTG